MENVHLGELIKKHVDDLGISHSKIARELGITPSGLMKNYKNESLHTDFVSRMSNILNHNFFEYVIPERFKSESKPDKNISYTTELVVTIASDSVMNAEFITRLNEFLSNNQT